MAAHDVFKAIGPQVDSDFLAIDILPILWQFSLGPLLNLQQFQAYMALIKSTSARIENEQTRKLHELGANNATATSRNEFMSFGGPSTMNGLDSTNGGDDTNFEALVRGGNQGPTGGSDMLGGDPWANGSASASASTNLPLHTATNRGRSSNNASPAATFAWSTPPVSPPPTTNLSAPPQRQVRAVTPDSTFSSLNSSFPAMSPMNPGIGSPTYASPPLQQNARPGLSMNSMVSSPTMTPNYAAQPASIDWSKAGNSPSLASTWRSASSNTTSTLSSFPSLTPQAQPQQQSLSNPYSGFSIAPPKVSSFNIAPPPPSNAGMGMGMGIGNRSTSAGNGMSMSSLRAQTQRQQGQSPNANQSQNQGWSGGGDSLI
jgi:SCY1-like protein 2